MKKEERPKIKLTLSRSEKVVDVLCWLILLAIWAITLLSYDKLPDVIPTHFNARGEADGFGEKWVVLFEPLLATILVAVLTVLGKNPHVFNYPVAVTPDNAEKLYSQAARILRYVKLAVVVIIGIIIMQTIWYDEVQSGFGIWFLPLALLLTMVIPIYFAIKSFIEK